MSVALADTGPHTKTLDQVMRLFGFTSFKSSEQEGLIRAIAQGKDALGILPTGGGKSACFIIPTIMNGWRTLVISPLKALMADQVQKLRKAGIAAICIHGDLTPEEKLIAVLTIMRHREGPLFIYAAPEMILSDWFRQHFGGRSIDLLVVDEGHCVSTWGEGFRPTYLQIKEIARRFKKPQCVVFSATIDTRIEKDIIARLPLRVDYVRVVADPYRDNLHITVLRRNEKIRSLQRYNRILCGEFIKLMHAQEAEFAGPTIVYLRSRKGATDFFLATRKTLAAMGYTPTLFHAMIPPADKTSALATFLEAKNPIVFATSAFGMGIDRADVRKIIHIDTPHTLVDYAQQIGRAGRDGLASECVVYFDPSQLEHIESQGLSTIPSLETSERVHDRLWKTWRGKDLNERLTMSLSGFMAHIAKGARESDALKNPEQYILKVNQSVALLQRVGLIEATDSGMIVHSLVPGSKMHLELGEATKASERMLARESSRLLRFFSDPNPDQRLLWQILAE